MSEKILPTENQNFKREITIVSDDNVLSPFAMLPLSVISAGADVENS